MHSFDATQTAALLPWRPLADAIRAAADARRSGDVHAPDRMAFPLAGDDRLLLMPASNAHHACVKLVSVNHGNPALGLPRLQGEVLLMERATGRRLAMFDGVALTARRTAAVSLAAAIALRTKAGQRLLIIGAGAQAHAHAQAFNEVLAPADIAISARSVASAQALVDRLASEGVRARVVDTTPGQLAATDLLVTATTSRQPVLADQLAASARVFAVGAFTPQMCELPGSLLRRARVIVDTLAGARQEAGDLIQAGIDWAGVTEIENAATLAGEHRQPVVFKSVGSALWDLASAELAWSMARD